MKMFYLFINIIFIAMWHTEITQVAFINMLSCYLKK